MPKLKQPGPLEKLAFDFLVANAVRCCIDLCEGDFLTELDQAVADIKHHLYDQLPGTLFLKFCSKFLEDFHEIADKRWFMCESDYCRAALGMIMDLNIVGLKCKGYILHYMQPSDANRIQGLTTLDLSRYCMSFSRLLDDFQLQDLTTFNLPMDCMDSDLEIIGSRCPKLEVLWISRSKRVTDKGLRALRPCSHLRVILIADCSVTEEGVKELLNIHGKLEQLKVSNVRIAPENAFGISYRPTSPVYPSMKSFALSWYISKNPNVHSALAMFPNLTSLALCHCFPDDFGVLKDLKSLTELKLTGNFSMRSLEPTLMDIGENIHVLSLNLHPAGGSQNDLNIIFKACRNLEGLAFHYLAPELRTKFFIPPFKKLRTLQMFPDSTESGNHLEFGVMPALEQFFIQAFDLISDVIESMLFDNVKFPNLKEASILFDEERQPDRINQIAKNKNIDFSLEVKCPPRL